MTSLIYPGITFYRRMFSLLIAPSSLLAEALNKYLKREVKDVLIISGEVPLILSQIQPGKFRLKVERASSGQEVFEILQKARESLILIEHDPAFYDYNADLIRSIALLSRKKVAGNQTILLLGTRPDTWLNKFESYVHKAENIEWNIQAKQKSSPGSTMRCNQISLNEFIKTGAVFSL
jgi:hypothetical protein